jgi:copper resistance protein C
LGFDKPAPSPATTTATPRPLDRSVLSAAAVLVVACHHGEKIMPSPIPTIAVAIVASLGLIGNALAHAHLKAAMPPVKGTVAVSPSELDLTFTEGVDLAFTGAAVAGPGKETVETGEAKLKSGDDATLIVPLTAPLSAGTYTVTWHALSKDGHKTKGSYTFIIKP